MFHYGLVLILLVTSLAKKKYWISAITLAEFVYLMLYGIHIDPDISVARVVFSLLEKMAFIFMVVVMYRMRSIVHAQKKKGLIYWGTVVLVVTKLLEVTAGIIFSCCVYVNSNNMLSIITAVTTVDQLCTLIIFGTLLVLNVYLARLLFSTKSS